MPITEAQPGGRRLDTEPRRAALPAARLSACRGLLLVLPPAAGLRVFTLASVKALQGLPSFRAGSVGDDGGSWIVCSPGPAFVPLVPTRASSRCEEGTCIPASRGPAHTKATQSPVSGTVTSRGHLRLPPVRGWQGLIQENGGKLPSSTRPGQRPR